MTGPATVVLAGVLCGQPDRVPDPARAADAPPPTHSQPTPTGCRCPCAQPAPSAPGTPEPFRRPDATAFALNREGRDLYRMRRWEEARVRYRAALTRDPAFRGPRLNVACAYAQEQRYAEAVREAADLVERDFVPGAREVMEAADLAPLHARPEMATLKAAIARAGRIWGAPLPEAVLFIARVEPAVRLPGRDVAGVLYLGLHQEIFAWVPAWGRYRQVTAEDGRVLTFVRSADGRRVTYVRAGKLVRTPGRQDALRGLTLRTLDLPTMTLGPVVPLPGDVVRLELWEGADGPHLRLTEADGPGRAYRVAATGLDPAPDTSKRNRNTERVVLGGSGVLAAPQQQGSGPECVFVARNARPRPGQAPAAEIAPRRGRPFRLTAPLGAALRGLPFP